MKAVNMIQRRYILHRLNQSTRCVIHTDDGKIIEGFPNNYEEGERIYINQRKRQVGRQVNELAIVGIEVKKGREYRRVL